jgi:hypothetical protein
MISREELEAREKYGFNAYRIKSGGKMEYITEQERQSERVICEDKPPKNEKPAASGYVCPDCGAISFMPVEKCDICKSKRKARKKTAPANTRIMSEREREDKKILLNRMNDLILKESLKTLPEEWSEEQKAAFNGKLTRLKIRYQELRQKLEDDLLARLDREQKG